MAATNQPNEEKPVREDSRPKEEERPRPTREDSGDNRGDQEPRSAAEEGDRSGTTSPPRPGEGIDPKLRKRVEDTEAWVERLKNARAEGTRITQEQTQSRRDTRQPQRPMDEVDAVVNALNRGDREFVETLLSASERRILQRHAEDRDNQALVDKITDIVGEHAPDVPMALFWHFTADAIAAAPSDMPRQIDIAIRLSRRELEERDKRVNSRRDENKANRENAETLDSTNRGPGRNQVVDEKMSLVDDWKAYQSTKR